MGFNGKHLSLEDRKIIEENINKGLRKFETAKELNKSQSTIGKEIKNNRKRRYSQTEDLGRLKQHKTSEEMSNSLNYFQELLGDDMYQKLFRLLLTDRGSEFAKPQLFEVNTETGEIRSNIFYCDAQMPSQKPHVENNHEFIRDIKEKIYVKFDTGQA